MGLQESNCSILSLIRAGSWKMALDSWNQEISRPALFDIGYYQHQYYLGSYK